MSGHGVRDPGTQTDSLCRLGDGAEGHEWEDREADLHRLVKDVTAQPQFRGPGRLLPTQHERELAFFSRYIPGAPPDSNSKCYCSVGVAGGLASAGGTPFWLRYHKETPDFQTISERIMASRYAPDARGNQGHIWLPLHVSLDRSGAVIIEELTAKIEEIRAVATGR